VAAPLPPLPPTRASTRLTAAGRAALPAAGASLIASWAFGGVIGLFAATAVAALALALLLARLHAAGVRVAPPGPLRAHVGDAFPLELELANVGRLAARHLIIAAGEGAGERGAAGLAALAPGASLRVAVPHRLRRRGRHATLVVTVASAFPLALVERRLVFELPADLLALPRLGSLNDLGRLPEARRCDAARRARPQRGDEEFYGVRAWRAGESLRRVHWRLSARRGRRIVREMRNEDEPPVHLTLATLASAGPPFDAPRRGFERAVSLTATLAEHLLRDGRTLRLVLAGAADATVDAARGRAGLLRVLTALAEVEMRVAAAGADGALPAELRAALRRAAERARSARGAAHVAVLAGGGAGATFAGLRAIDVDHPDAARLFLPGRRWGMGAPLGLRAGALAGGGR
jgi:uncharacterized protein (DUF58 family)